MHSIRHVGYWLDWAFFLACFKDQASQEVICSSLKCSSLKCSQACTSPGHTMPFLRKMLENLTSSTMFSRKREQVWPYRSPFSVSVVQPIYFPPWKEERGELLSQKKCASNFGKHAYFDSNLTHPKVFCLGLPQMKRLPEIFKWHERNRLHFSHAWSPPPPNDVTIIQVYWLNNMSRMSSDPSWSSPLERI